VAPWAHAIAPSMGAGVNATAKALAMTKAPVGQILGKSLGDLIPVGRWATRADDRDDVPPRS
jgi:hypothetical protein